MNAHFNPLLPNSSLQSSSRTEFKSLLKDTIIQNQYDQSINTINYIKDPNETITESDEEPQPQIESSKYNQKTTGTTTTTTGKRKTSKSSLDQGRWSDQEHQLFLEGLMMYGNEWKMVQEHIQTRSSTQARSHAQKFFIKIKKNIQHEKTIEGIKETIQEIFQEEMKEKFKPKDLPEFLERIYKLVIVSPLNIKRVTSSSCIKIPLKCYESDSICGSMNPRSTYNNYGGDSSEKDNSDPYAYEQNMVHKKENYFYIQKDSSRRSSINNNMIDSTYQTALENTKSHYLMSYDNDNNIDDEAMRKLNANLNPKTTYENSSKRNIIKSPSCINYYNVTLVDNSTNNIMCNFNDKPQKKQQKNSMQYQSIQPPKQISYSKESLTNINECKSNAFNLPFEQIYDQSPTKNNHIFDLDLNFQEEDYHDIYNDSFHSLNF